MRKIYCYSIWLCLSFGYFSTAAQTAREWYDLGKGNYYAADYEKAISDFEKAKLAYAVGKEPGFEMLKCDFRIAKCYEKMRQNHKAIVRLESIIQALKPALDDEESELLADCWMEHGNVLEQMFRSDKSEQSYSKALDLYADIYGKESSQVGNVYMNIGTGLTKLSRYRDAEKYMLRAFNLFKKVSKPDSEDFNRIYSNMGYLYRKMGDMEKAERYGKKALEIKLKNYAPNHPSVAKYYRNLSKVYAEYGNHNKAIRLQEKALEIAEYNFGNKHEETMGELGELAVLYMAIGDYKKAIKMEERVYQFRSKTQDPNHPYVLSARFNIASAYSEMGEHDKAISYYENTIRLLDRRRQNMPENLAMAQREIAWNALQESDFDKASAYVDSALITLDAIGYETQADLPQAEAMFWSVLKLKSTLLERLALVSFKKQKQGKSNEKGIKHLENALKTLDFAIQQMETTHRQYHAEKTQLYLKSESKNYYQQAVRLSFLLFDNTKNEDYLWRALDYMDKGKAAVMRQSLNEAYALEQSSISPQLLTSLDELGRQISTLQNIEKKTLAESDKYFKLQEQYANLLSDLEKENANYFSLKYASFSVDRNRVFKKLRAEKATLLSYCLNDSMLYAICVQNGSIRGFSTAFSDKEKNIIQYIVQYNPNQLFSSQTDSLNVLYAEALFDLYDVLIKPLEHYIYGAENLYILPTDVLHYLPFEILCPRQQNPDFPSLNYLLKNTPVFYHWSIALWMENIKSPKKPKQQLACFAPVFSPPIAEADNTAYRSHLGALPYAQKECDAALNWINGKGFYGAQATETAFWENASDFQVLHFATHAEVDDAAPTRSKLYFDAADSLHDGMLHLYELYGLDLAADLVVLSACNSGNGELAEGEGVLNLGRGFRYAGCPSVIMSLWLANDQSTSTIMGHFYKHLKAKKSKSGALRQAKLDYLKTADGVTAHPYFWAGIVGIGDAEAMDFPTDSTWTLWFGIGLGVLVLMGYWFLKNRNSTFGQRK